MKRKNAHKTDKADTTEQGGERKKKEVELM